MDDQNRVIIPTPLIPGEDVQRIRKLKQLAEEHGLGLADHFMVGSGRFCARKVDGALLAREAARIGIPIDLALRDSKLRERCYTEERLIDNLMVTVGLEFIVDAFQDIVELELMRFHAVGTGTTSPVVGNTTLETEDLLGNANRPSGTQTESGATTYQTVATITQQGAGPTAITEAGILSVNAVGVLLARQTFAAINLSLNDSIETTWEFTVS
jgi:hypothetical protein